MNYNLVLYIGLFLIVGCFFLFILSEMNKRRCDRKQWQQEQLSKSFMKGRENERT